MIYLNTTISFEVLPVLVFQLEIYCKVDRLLTGLTAQQKGTAAGWFFYLLLANSLLFSTNQLFLMRALLCANTLNVSSYPNLLSWGRAFPERELCCSSGSVK